VNAVAYVLEPAGAVEGAVHDRDSRLRRESDETRLREAGHRSRGGILERCGQYKRGAVGLKLEAYL
jgi:hypothetical protein